MNSCWLEQLPSRAKSPLQKRRSLLSLSYVDNEKRPDIVVFDSGDGFSTDLDIALSHPWSQEAMKGSATTVGYAATLGEDRKTCKIPTGKDTRRF